MKDFNYVINFLKVKPKNLKEPKKLNEIIA